jgi:hypothetical protein
MLVVFIVGLMLFGLLLVLLPDLAAEAFSLLVYSSRPHLDSFGFEAMSYIKLVHAVLGAVMFGWGVLFLFLARGPLRQGSRDAWRMFVVSLVAWYLPDTAFSLVSGFWQNAVLNTAIAVLFALPLVALRSGALWIR